MNNMGGWVEGCCLVHHHLNIEGVRGIGDLLHVVVHHGEAMVTQERVGGGVRARLEGCKLVGGLRYCHKRKQSMIKAKNERETMQISTNSYEIHTKFV